MGNGTKVLQANLKREGFYQGAIDGIRGAGTIEGVRKWATKVHGQPQGFDASAYQADIDWEACRVAGVTFVFLRCSVSIYPDKLFKKHWAGAKEAGILRAAYHFFAPWQNAKAQAELVATRLDDDHGELAFILDVESLAPKAKEGEAPPTPVTKQELIHRIDDCLTEIERLLGRRPILYTYASFAWEHSLGASFPNHKLALADYREGPPELLGGYTQYAFHQYAGDTGRQVGVKGPCDLDYFNGTLEELMGMAELGNSPVEEEVKEPEPKEEKPTKKTKKK